MVQYNIPKFKLAPKASKSTSTSSRPSSTAQPAASLACLSALLLCSPIQIVLIISSSPPLAFHLFSSESSRTLLKNNFLLVSRPSLCPCINGFVFVILLQYGPLSREGDLLFCGCAKANERLRSGL